MGFWGTTFAFCVLEGACAVYINATGIRGANRPETFAECDGGDVHVDDVGDNIHGADVSAGTAGEE